MQAPDDIHHLRQLQAKHGMAIGGIKSCLKDNRDQLAQHAQGLHEAKERLAVMERNNRTTRSYIYFIAVFIIVFYTTCCVKWAFY